MRFFKKNGWKVISKIQPRKHLVYKVFYRIGWKITIFNNIKFITYCWIHCIKLF